MAWTTIGPVSVASRLNRIYPEGDLQGHVPFIYQVQTQFPWFVATGNNVTIRSQISETLPPY